MDDPRIHERGADHRCLDVEEAISAHLDGEPHAMPVEAVRAHLAGCEACARFEAVAGGVARRVRVASAQPVPDLTASITATLTTEHLEAARRRTMELRGLVALAGVVQLVLAIPALVGVVGADVHAGRELGALQLALGVGLVLAAWQPQRTAGVLPIAGVVAVAAVVVAGLDVLGGTVSLAAELTHLAEVVGVLSLWALHRRVPAGPRPQPNRPVPA